jgi:predicted ArsR family transcriptional regulator
MPGTEPLDPADLKAQIAVVAALDEPVRRALYEYAVSRPVAVGRDEASQAVGVSRELAAFHLDKLVQLGMLEVEFRRLSGRRGPGAGRPAKLYRPSDRQIEVAFPDRRYELAGHLLARALEDNGTLPAQSLDRTARRFGEQLGAEARRDLGRRPSRARLLQHAEAVLRSYGFEPAVDDGEIHLRNCPFDGLAREHRELVCGMNLAILEGLLTGLRTEALTAKLAPEPGMCCVVVSPAPAGERRGSRVPGRRRTPPAG